MYPLIAYDPIDYLVVGHITQDLTPNGQCWAERQLIRR
jgi:hypothetical protein